MIITNFDLKKLRTKMGGVTLIEVMVAVTVIAILSSLVVLNVSEARKTSRDTRRKADVQTYVNAINAYRSANGSFFITGTDGTDPCPIDTNQIKKMSFSGGLFTCEKNDGTPATYCDIATISPTNKCIGAFGRSYGRMNFAGGTESITYKDNNNNTEDRNIPYNGTQSLANALQKQGFVATIALDPKTSNSLTPKDADYVLIRSCFDGNQSVNKGGAYFSVIARLEKTPLSLDIENTQKLPGGKLAKPDKDNGSGVMVLDESYQFDYASQNLHTKDSIDYFFASGNARPKTSTSFLDADNTCAGPVAN